MALHTVNKHDDYLVRCLSLVGNGDAVLLIEDGVYGAMDTPINVDTWKNISAAVECFALESDLAARGISDKMLPFFTPVSWQQFIALTEKHDKVISWG